MYLVNDLHEGTMDDDDIEDVALSPQQLLRPTPFSGGNSYLWGLKQEVEDDRHIRILDDIAKLIRISDLACDEAIKNGPTCTAEARRATG